MRIKYTLQRLLKNPRFYLYGVGVIIILIAVISFSMAMFTDNVEKDGVLNITTGNLYSSITSDYLDELDSIVVSANSSKTITVYVNNPNEIDAKFNLYYTSADMNLVVYYREEAIPVEAGNLINKGDVSKYTLYIENNSSSEQSVTIKSDAGLVNDDLIYPGDGKIIERYFATGESSDTSGANAPGNVNDLIPVIYSSDGSMSKAGSDNWYNYSTGSLANAVLVTSSSQEEYQSVSSGYPISNADVIGEYVWIPKFSVDGSNVVFQDIDSNDEIHEAFNGKEAGFWISKYMLSDSLGDSLYTYEENEMLYSVGGVNTSLHVASIPTNSSKLDTVDTGDMLDAQIAAMNNNNIVALGSGNNIRKIESFEYEAVELLVKFYNPSYSFYYSVYPLVTDGISTNDNYSGIYNFVTDYQYTYSFDDYNLIKNQEENNYIDFLYNRDFINNKNILKINEVPGEPDYINEPPIYQPEMTVFLTGHSNNVYAYDDITMEAQVICSDREGSEVTYEILAPHAVNYGNISLDPTYGRLYYELHEDARVDAIYSGLYSDQSISMICKDVAGVETPFTFSIVIRGVVFRGERSIIVSN